MSNAKWGNPSRKETGPDRPRLKKQSCLPPLPPPCPSPLFLNFFPSLWLTSVSHQSVPHLSALRDLTGGLSSHPHPQGWAEVQTHPLFQRPPQRGSFLAGTFPRQKMICLLGWCARRTGRGSWFSTKGFHKALPILYQWPLCHRPVSFHNPLSVSIICSVSQISFHFSQLHLGLRPSEACQGDPWHTEFCVPSTTTGRDTACTSPRRCVQRMEFSCLKYGKFNQTTRGTRATWLFLNGNLNIKM